MSRSMRMFWPLWDQIGLLAALLIAVVVFGMLDSRTVSPNQLLAALNRTAVPGIAAAGMMFAIVSGGFDLSVGSILSLTSCVAASLLVSGRSTLSAVMTALLAAALCGVINGIIITKLRIQALFATLATRIAFAGITLVYSNKAIRLTGKVNAGLKFFSHGKLLGLFAMPVVLLFSVYLLAAFVYFKTPFGTKVRAVGSDEGAARTTGIGVDGTLMLVFVITAVTAAVAGVLNTAQISAGSPTLGSGFELDAIIAVVLGGTALSGGKGNVPGTLAGAFLVTFVKMGLDLLGAGEACQKMAVAIVLLFALTINGIKQRLWKGGR